MQEQWPIANPPEEIKVSPETLEFKTNAEGKKYSYEKDGQYYGGDYLPEAPSEIDINFPPAPPEEKSPAL
jgi:hypothetical protein